MKPFELDVKAVLAISTSLLFAACADSGVGLEQLELEIVGPAEELRLEVLATLASSAEERMIGLSKHERLPADEGLLLVFPNPGRVCISNRSVRFPIDAVFLSAEQRVIAIERDLPAHDPDTHCQLASSFVLELAAGAARGVRPGDRLQPPNIPEALGLSTKRRIADPEALLARP